MLLASTNQIERTVKQVLPVLAAVVAFGWMERERDVVGMCSEAQAGRGRSNAQRTATPPTSRPADCTE
jgi:hypothetical protein